MKNILLAILSLCVSAIMYFCYFKYDQIVFLGFGILFTIIIVIFIMLVFFKKERIKSKQLEERLEIWNSLSYHVSQAGDEAVNNLPVGILVYEDGIIKWTNDYLKTLFKSRLVEELISEALPQVYEYIDTKKKSFIIQFENQFIEVLNYKEQQVLYFFDVTEREVIKNKYDNRIAAIGIILLDNLEQSLRDYDMQEKSTIRGEFLGEISDYVREYGAYLQSYEDDRLIMILDKESLYEMMKNNFDLLNKTREISTKNHVRVSVSIGVACYDVEADELGQLAQSAIELAEKRGGDQVVVNIQNEKIQYFGGKTNALEKNSLVNARVQAATLKDLIEKASNIYITGHIGADADCFGSMLPVLSMALQSNKDANIVFEMSKADQNIKKLVDVLTNEAHELAKRIIPYSEVDIKANTLLIVCDTQSPKIMMYPELYDKIKTVAIIDHHRRGEIGFDNVQMSYVEPYASSTVELVTEMLLFYSNDVQISPIEATCMLAGLVIDTNNFTFRASSRTFEAASIIKNYGAEMIRVRTLLRSDFETEQEIALAISKADIFMGKYAIVHLGDDFVNPDRSFLAQIADKLMTIDNVEASFAIGKLAVDTVGISARSYEKINVQLIMEEMGGGGHLSNAATQIKNMTISAVKDKLCEILKINNEDEGEEKMKVILLQDIKGRGVKNQTIEVANGYGNYLLTNKLAMMATDENVKIVEEQKAQALIDEENHRKLMEKLKAEIESKSINVYIKVGADGKTFGHITSKQICEEYEAQTGTKLDKRKVNLPVAINSVGIFTATVDLYKDIQASIEIHVLEK